jgi:outer membrane biosynthesis protein TonB
LGSGGQPGQSGYHFPPEPEPNNYDYAQPASYGQPAPAPYYANGAQQPPFPPQQQWGQQPDPRGYDLGTYMPAAPQQPYPPVDPNQFRQPQEHAYGTRQGYADPDADYDDEEFADGNEPGRGRRWMFVAAVALVGAVGLGGALAYTYKSLFAPSAGRVPIVRADQGNKAKPSEKMLGRLGDDAQAAAPGAEPQDDRAEETGGPKRVKTIPINPGAPMVAGSPPSPQVSPSMPGVMVDIGPRPQVPPPKTAQPLQPRVTLGVPPANMVPQAAPQEEAPPLKRSVATPQPPVAKPSPPPKQAASTPPPTTASTGAGFVAVLSSQKTRMDALKVFADLQQRYPGELSGKVPDVREADLSNQGLGTMYRLVVGPPGSRSAASGVCVQLKAAGLKDCWVMEY